MKYESSCQHYLAMTENYLIDYKGKVPEQAFAMYKKVIAFIRASGEVWAEGPNRAAQRTLGKIGIKNQTTSPPSV